MALNTAGRTENAKRNMIFAVVNKLASLMLVFVGRRFFIRYIGIEYLGINGLFANVLTLLSLAELGVGTAMNVSLYKPLAQKDTKRLSALLDCFRRLYVLIAIGVAVIGTCLMPFLKYIINTDADIAHLNLYYMVFVLKNSVSYLFAYKSALISADQKNSYIDRIEIASGTVKTAVQIISVVLFGNYLLYILIDAAYVLVRNIIVSYVANREYPFIKDRAELGQGEKRRLFSDIFSVFLYKLSYVLINGTDNILMSVIVSTASVGLYANYFTLTDNIEGFLAMIFMAMTAGVGNLVATEDCKKRYEVFEAMQTASFWLGGVVCVCVLLLTQDFIVIWLGEDMLLDNLTLAAITLNLFFAICMRPVWIFREGTGMYRRIKYVMLVTAALNLVLSIFLGRRMGMSGIIFATFISKLLTYFWYEPRVLFRGFFGKSPKSYYKGYLVNVLAVAGGIGVCALALSFITAVNIFAWLAKAVICFTVMNGIYFVIYRRSPGFALILKKSGKLLKKS